jgi:hypothetical protein
MEVEDMNQKEIIHHLRNGCEMYNYYYGTSPPRILVNHTLYTISWKQIESMLNKKQIVYNEKAERYELIQEV